MNEEINSIDTDTAAFVDLRSGTTVGGVIASLSADSHTQRITQLATLTSAETSRLGELDKTLAENDPKAKAKELRLSAQRIEALISRIEKAIACVDDAALDRLDACDSDAQAATKAEAIAAKKFRANDVLLPGTGERVWKALFEAARRFSTEAAYPQEPFPNVAPGAKCPLCQQDLGQQAAERLRRFGDFVKQDTAKAAVEKGERRIKAIEVIQGASIDFGLDPATTEELRQLDEALLKITQNFGKKAGNRKRWLLSAVKVHTFDGPPALDSDPRPDLKALSARILKQALELGRASDNTQRTTLLAQRAELRARASLLPRLKALVDLIQRMKTKDMLTRCKGDLGTRQSRERPRSSQANSSQPPWRTRLKASSNVWR